MLYYYATVYHTGFSPVRTSLLFYQQRLRLLLSYLFFLCLLSMSPLNEFIMYFSKLYTHICGIKGCGGAECPPPPPIIFERLQLPQQIIYRRKENLSESPNHQKYWENILVSRFYEQFSRNRRNLGHFRKFEKISNS